MFVLFHLVRFFMLLVRVASASILSFRNSIPQEMKDIYKTVWEIKMKSVIDLAADRGAFVDQSQVRT